MKYYQRLYFHLRVTETEHASRISCSEFQSQNMSLLKKWKNGYLLPYEFDDISFMNYREHVINCYNISQFICRKTIKPRIVFVDRDTKMRNIINGKELHEEMKKWAPNIDTDYMIFNNQSMKEQIEEICNASILISIHGSALSHML